MKTRRRIRRRVARQAPKVRRCACGGARDVVKDRIGEAGGLMIGGAKDPAEAKADARASHALASGPFAAPPVRRQCAACAAEETAQRSPAAGVVAPGGAPARASKAAETAVNSLGPGRPLSGPERAFYEPRLGADLAPVRLHEDAAADHAAHAMDASAFTLGKDIAFASGERQLGGPRLLAHELAHAAEEAPEVRRKLRVERPNRNIRRPKGKGVKQTNAETVRKYLDNICMFGGVRVAKSGKVSVDAETCGLFYGLLEQACDCLCDIVNSKHKWSIAVRDDAAKDSDPATWSDPAKASDKSGTGGLIVVPSPNNTKEFGRALKAGGRATFADWEILLHELCGHARLIDKGAHPKKDPAKIRHGHETVVDEVNAIRTEKGMTDLRGSRITDPWCGESFFREKDETKWTPSTHLKKCEDLRSEYLKKMRKKNPQDPKFKKKFKISDTLP